MFEAVTLAGDVRSQIARFDDVRPTAVAPCHGPEDVVAALAFAQREGLPLALRSGGHCFAGRSSTTGVLVDVGPMHDVVVGEGTVTVGAGARLNAVYDALAARGRTIAAGCGPTVGIAGLALGGGLGILGRSRGLTADQVIAMQAVSADGRIVECDEQQHEELFWALRGAGGGQFAAVTRLVLRTLPAPRATAFYLLWPYEAAARVASAWQGWSPEAPDAIAASLVIKAMGSAPPSVLVFGALLDDEPAARRALGEFVERADAQPAKAIFVEAPYREVKRHLAEYDVAAGVRRPVEREPGHLYSKSEFFRCELPPDAIEALLTHFIESRNARVLDFTPWGGAYNRVPVDATAFAHRAERFLLKQEVVVEAGADDAEREAAREWLTRSWELVHPYGSGGVYPNFPDPDLEDWPRAYHGPNLERLMRVKAQYDPGNVFRFAQSVPAA
jgi:FAD/FMN-containing dehydrogenase